MNTQTEIFRGNDLHVASVKYILLPFLQFVVLLWPLIFITINHVVILFVSGRHHAGVLGGNFFPMLDTPVGVYLI